MADQLPDIGTPRWVKVSGIIGAALILMTAVMIFVGHGPGRHIPRGDTTPSDVTEDTSGDLAPTEGDRR